MPLRIIAATLLLATLPIQAGPAFAQDAAKPYSFARSVQFDLTSKINGRAYRIFVHTPPVPPPPGGYPVLYVTDGNGTFPIAAGQAELDALAGGHMMVVGIGYPAEDMMSPLSLRNRDLTPSPPTTPMAGMSAKPDDYGGGEAFYQFITGELRPAIAAAFKVSAADQTLYGHSLGGLFTLGVLFRHPDAFRGFAISSPSIWWNGREVLKDEAAFSKLVEMDKTTPRILIEVGGLEESVPKVMPPGMTEAEYRKMVGRSRMVGNARDLAERLSVLKGGPGYAVQSQVFDNETHISTMAASLSRAISFADGN